MIRSSWIAFALFMSLSSASWALSHTGKILETMNSGGYTYAKVSEGSDEFWIALPITPVEIGQTITFSEQMWMSGFTSKTLNRQFDRLLFVDKLAQGAVTLPTTVKEPAKNPQPAETSNVPEVDLNEAKAYTVADLFAKKTELKGKPVHVQGQVAKVSNGIMGTNWIHIKDGTGKPGSDDIIFRSKTDTATVGDTVDAKGVLVTDQDFGMSYQYPVLVEQASINVVK